jgi:hypothetical protein
MTKIWVYVLCYNEEKIIPYFLNHYSFADKIIVYDNESTDKSRLLFEQWSNKNSSPQIEIRTYKSNNQLNDQLYLDIKNNAWKEAKNIADFVIVIDMDEFLVCDFKGNSNSNNIISFCQKYSDYSIFNVTGYDMFSESDDPDYDINKPLIEQCQFGAPSIGYCKNVLFSPIKLTEINYDHGCHKCSPEGDIKYPENSSQSDQCNQLKLLHFKHAFGLQFVINRASLFNERLSEINRMNCWGMHYSFHPDEHVKYYENIKNLSRKVI